MHADIVRVLIVDDEAAFRNVDANCRKATVSDLRRKLTCSR